MPYTSHSRFEDGWRITWDKGGNPSLHRVKVENYNGQVTLLQSSPQQPTVLLSPGVDYFTSYDQALETLDARTIDAIRGHEHAISLLKIQRNSIKEEQKHAKG